MTPIPEKAKVGVVIGTYGSPAYVHLGVVGCQSWDAVNVLIHDDGSPYFGELEQIGFDHNAAIYTTGKRLSKSGESMLGDISAFAVGLEYAAVSGIDILVKLSRRFIINRPWVEALQELAHNTQYATYSGTDMSCGLGFRSECCALHVPSWIDSGALDMLCAQLGKGEQPVHGLVGGAEGWYHEIARHVHRWAHPDARDPYDLLAQSESHFTRSETWSGYGVWPMLGLSRTQRIPGIYWHGSRSLAEYAALAQEFGLPYTESDFVIPEDAL